MSFDIGIASYTLASFCLVSLLLAQLKIWSSGNSSLVLLIATSMTLIWCLCLLFQTRFSLALFYIIPVVETLKNLFWFTLLLSILGIRKIIFPRFRGKDSIKGLVMLSTITLGVPSSLFLYILYLYFIDDTIVFFPAYGGQVVLIGFLLSAIVGLALLEQVIRNTRYQHRWHLKFLCLGLGILFSFDIYLYSNALLFERIQDSLWQIRGSIIALSTPFIAIGVLRTRQQPIQVNISRRLVFHSGVLVAVGLYLLLMASAGFYLRNYSSEWGSVLQIMFLVVSLSLLVVLIYSGRIRSILKVYISRHLFSTKYDYRDEWLRISRTLSQRNDDESVPDSVIHALADTVDSPAGGLWLTSNGNHYDQVAQIEFGWVENSGLTNQDYLIELLQKNNRVIDLHSESENLDQSQAPRWLSEVNKAWLIIPLELHEKLLGFVLLRESRVEFDLNWEGYDLLKAAGQQAASYLAQMVASDSLAEARQFSAFNQVSAFVVHDIKTLNSQLSLMVTNAEKFKTNPSFIEDMIKTSDHAVNKMNVLLKHFKSEENFDREGSLEYINLAEIIPQIIASQTAMQPTPVLRVSEDQSRVLANEAELKSCIGHLIQNAQDATPDDGSVDVELSLNNGMVQIAIRDTGVGMSQEFIKTRLFKPFESTKGLTGMGIGVFQSRESIRKLGGNLLVHSQPSIGSEFIISLPISNNNNDQD
ncbi:MAG: PEP-CTERM system histidine kinase PrsK [SAR86 cluster bacterium]|uniref:histidine kinase n=1 Tax=SAR86 cluster bacterium TaxID=2030880 RepID=A0A2A5B7I3_9GAMM|nr:MAG: PEP-CTERM system histidine kinase PrsK [SAR86 cluster bacterium]